MSRKAPSLICGLAFVVVLSIVTPSYAADPLATGLVEGRVIYHSDRKRSWRYRRYYVQDRDKGFLAEALVILEPETPQDRPGGGARTVVVDQKDYRFIPETVAIQAGDTIRFTNSDPFVHDVTSQSKLKQFSFTLSPREKRTETFPVAGDTKEPITLGCRFHSSMRGWIYVFEHRLSQVTDLDGRFRLENVAPGKYDLVVVHPAGELRWSREIEVTSGSTEKIEVHLSPDDVVQSGD